MRSSVWKPSNTPSSFLTPGAIAVLRRASNVRGELFWRAVEGVTTGLSANRGESCCERRSALVKESSAGKERGAGVECRGDMSLTIFWKGLRTMSKTEQRVVDGVTRRPRVVDSEDSGTVVSVPGPGAGMERRVVDDVTRRPRVVDSEDGGTVVSVPSPGAGRWFAGLSGETTGSNVVVCTPLPNAL